MRLSTLEERVALLEDQMLTSVTILGRCHSKEEVEVDGTIFAVDRLSITVG